MGKIFFVIGFDDAEVNGPAAALVVTAVNVVLVLGQLFLYSATVGYGVKLGLGL